METLLRPSVIKLLTGLKSSCEEWKLPDVPGELPVYFGLKSSCEEWKHRPASLGGHAGNVLNLPVRNGNSLSPAAWYFSQES